MFTTFLILSHTEHICGRWHWKSLSKNIKNLNKCLCNQWIELKTLSQKEKLLIMNTFSCCHNVFKSCLLQRSQQCDCMWERIYSYKPGNKFDNFQDHEHVRDRIIEVLVRFQLPCSIITMRSRYIVPPDFLFSVTHDYKL